MLRSPLANPMTTPMINPVRAGLSKITRAILNFNGTQYAELSERISLSGPYKIEFIGTWPQSSAGGYWLANNDEDSGNNRLVVNSGRDIFGAGFTGQQVSFNYQDPKLHRFTLVRDASNTVTFSVDGVVEATTTSALDFEFNSVGDQFGGPTGVGIYSGVLLRLLVEDSGELVTDLRFDEPDTIYQRNYAVPLGLNLADSAPSNLRETWTDNGDGSFTAMSNGEYLAVEWSGVVAGKVYKISYDIVHHGDGGVRVINGAVSEPWNVSTVDGHREVYVTADSTSLGFRHDNDAHFTISNISIREWSGAILENTLPGDWEEISKKVSDDFWLGSDLYTQAVWENPFSVGDQWTYEPVTNTWLMVGDGELNPIQLLGQADQPESAMLKYKVRRLSGDGSAALTSSPVDGLYTINNADFGATGFAEGTTTLNANDLNQSFKRRGGVLTMRVSKPALYKYLEYAEGAL